MSKKYDSSEYDSIKKIEYHAKLLRDKAININNQEEQRRLFEAANTFDNAAREAWAQR